MTVALAQETGVLDEIMVTARKREESAQDIPVALTALGGDDIESLKATAMSDIIHNVPNLMMDPNGNSLNSWGMRGIVSVTRNAGQESGLGVYIDGVYAGRPTAFNVPLNDIQQVEVLRGPQGSLFGRNTIAGAINITTRRPGDEVSGEIRASAGNFSTYGLQGSVSGPLVDGVLGGKISAYSFQRDGYVDNPINGQDYMSDDRVGGRGALYWTPSDAVEVVFAADIMELDNKQTWGQTLEPQLNVFVPDWYQADPFLVTNNDPSWDKVETGGGSLTINWDLANGHTLTSITAQRYADFDLIGDDDAGPITLTYSHFVDDSDTFSQEFRLTSPTSETFDYIAGFYYLDQEVKAIRDTPLVPYPDTVVGIFSDTVVKTDAWAIFGTANFYLSDAFTLSIGLRYTDEEKETDFTQIENAGLGFPNVTFTPSQQDDGVSGDISLIYAVNDNMNVYGSIRKGIKSGGFQTDIIFFDDPSLFEFGPEEALSFELGLKGQSSDRRFKANAAIFRTDYTDMQVGQLLGLGFTTTNAGESEITGVELELDWLATDNLALGLSAGFLDHEYTEYFDCVDIGIHCSGNDLQLVPDTTLAVTIDYSVPLQGGSSLEFHIDANHRAEYFTDAVNDPDLLIEDRTLLNARLGYEWQDKGLGIYVWGKNLTDETYDILRWKYPVTPLAFGPFDPTITGLEGLVGAPRTYGVELSWHF
jgi:iron complex outermembrane receptor protein